MILFRALFPAGRARLGGKLLEIDEDQSFQEKMWVAQRVGWVLLLLFLLAAVFGYTGASSLTTVKEERGGYRLKYPRFGRIGTPFELVVSGPGGEVFFSREILQRNELTNAVPSPRSSEALTGGLRLKFEAVSGGEIHFDWKPRRAGRLKGKVALGEPPVEFEVSQFVYF